MDYNFVIKNDFGGEAYLSMKDVPGVFNPSKGYHRQRAAELTFMKPQNVKGESDTSNYT